MSDISYGFLTKNRKMDGTQSSENESLRGDMSYLYGRDPSILAYGQRPFPSQESKKNLISLLEEEKEDDSIESLDKISTSTDIPSVQTIKVFLRMKPFPRKMKLTPQQLEAYSLLNSTTLLTKMASLDNNTSCLKKIKSSDIVCRKFIFTQTFGGETTQLELFEQAVKPQMVDYLAGKNSVVMTYGTTNSGKTYTLQGTSEHPGIIPRGIEFVFSNINPRPAPLYKPVNSCDVIYLTSHERLQEMDFKVKLLAFNPTERTFHANTYKQMQHLLHEESPIRPSHNYDAHYSVWISFAEIYNETIYDLLWSDCQKKRPALKLATDNKGRAYIKGLRSVCVNSGAEAYQVLMAGQYNLKVAATALNSRSSRSHCIFTINLLKYRTDNDPYSVDISTFAFCDLAGSERLKKTLNIGERLKEAQNINTSLLVLGRCLKTIYETQNSKQKFETIGPFRESKLTRLFQRALSGKEQIALIVNVNPVPNLYVETQNVLNFSAIAKRIVVEPAEIVKRRRSQSRFSRLVTQSMKTDMDWENTELDDMTEATDDCSEQESDIDEQSEEVYEELLLENEMLKKEIKELKASVLTRDMQTRKEMTEMYSDIMKKLEDDFNNRLVSMEEQQEELQELAVERIELYYKEKLNKISVRKRSRQSETDDEDDNKTVLEDLEAENAQLLAKIEALKKSIRALKQSKESAEAERTSISFELAVVKDEAKRANEMLVAAQKSIGRGDDVSSNYIEELQEVIKKKDERIKTMKTFLNEAKEEYISITNQAQTMEEKVKDQHELLVENKEHIQDLEEQLVQANAYSAEQSKIIENLEEELDKLTRKLIEKEEKIKDLDELLQKSDVNESNIVLQVTNHLEENVNEKDDFEETKALLEEMKLRFELSEKENLQLKEKLNQRVSEIVLLKNNLDLTKDQLDKVTEKVNSLEIEDEKAEVKNTDTVEQGIQTEVDNSFDKELLDNFNTSCQVSSKVTNISCQASQSVANISCQVSQTVANNSCQVSPDIANISCQTTDTVAVETHEKLLQTSFLIEEVDEKLKTISLEIFQELQEQHEEIKKVLESCRVEKINSEKQFEETIKELQSQISSVTSQMEEKNNEISIVRNELKKSVEASLESKEEMKDLKVFIEAQDSKCKNLMEQITQAHSREQDKDNEIASLQKETKTMIHSNEDTLKKMESEMKAILKELTSTKEQLTKTEEKSRKVDKEYKQVIHILEKKVDSLEQKLLDKQVDNDKLKVRIEELKNALVAMEHEMKVFTKNRDETVSKYEDLVKNQYDELAICKKEVKKLQDLLQEGKENTISMSIKGSVKKSRCNVREEKKKTKALAENTENTSEEDYLDGNQLGKIKPKKEFLTPTKDNHQVIELSGSESKKSTRSTTKSVEPPMSTRRTRRKKLFTPLDESFIDIDPSEPSPSPCTTRNLRNRKK